MLGRRYNILFLATWYPNRIKSLEGIFVKKHALSANNYSDISVIYIGVDPNLDKSFEIVIEKETILTIYIYLSQIKKNHGITTLFYNAYRFFISCKKAYKIFLKEKGKPDLIQVNVAGRIGLYAVLMKLLYKIPYIVQEHSATYVCFKDREEYKKQTPFIERIITSLVFRHADHILSVSSYLSNSIKNIKKIKNNYDIVENVVDYPENLHKTFDKNFISSISISLLETREKNIFELIDAVKTVVKKGYNNYKCFLIGEGKERILLEKYAKDSGILNKNFFFLGYIPNKDLSFWFSKTNFFILPSKYETFSVVTAEAMANGLPVLCTKCGGPEEFVNKEHGLIVDNNSEKLVEGIIYMIENWKSYNEQIIHDYIKSKFSEKNIGSKFFNIYEKVLARQL